MLKLKIYFNICICYVQLHSLTKMMSCNLLSKIENGCFGKMKLEDGKLVFECIQPPLSPPPPSHYSHPSPPPSPHPSPTPHQVPAPSAPPLVEENRNIDELKDELRETKERLAILEEQIKKVDLDMKWRISRAECDIDKLHSFREAVWMPKMSQAYGDLYDLNTKVLHIISVSDTYNVNICNKVFCPHIKLEDRLDMLDTLLRRERIRNIVIQPNQSNLGIGQLITPSCVKVIRFILDCVQSRCYKGHATLGHVNLQITITSNTPGTLAVGFVVSLCEQLKPESPVKIVITQARISEQTELKNKVDKDIFNKIEFEKIVSSV